MTAQYAPDAAMILRLAEEVRASLPAPAPRLEIAEMAEADICIDLDMDDPYDLSGLYEGIPLAEKSDPATAGTDRVILYRRAILDEWCARGDVSLADLVRQVVVQEMAHHFGWSDAEIAALEAGTGTGAEK